MEIKPIAHIHTFFKSKFGVPRQSGRAPSLMGRIVFEPEYRNPDALRGIEGFSHLWLIFDFSMSHKKDWSPTVRPPRLGGNRRMGVFATRSPFRPNPIGLSSVELVRVENTQYEGAVIVVSGVDLIDMTPILDIKPYLPDSDSHPDASSGFAGIFSQYKLDVKFDDELKKLIPAEHIGAVTECLADDPRPGYQDDPERVYSMEFAGYDVSFMINNNICTVTDIKKIK